MYTLESIEVSFNQNSHIFINKHLTLSKDKNEPQNPFQLFAKLINNSDHCCILLCQRIVNLLKRKYYDWPQKVTMCNQSWWSLSTCHRSIDASSTCLYNQTKKSPHGNSFFFNYIHITIVCAKKTHLNAFCIVLLNANTSYRLDLLC